MYICWHQAGGPGANTFELRIWVRVPNGGHCLSTQIQTEKEPNRNRKLSPEVEKFLHQKHHSHSGLQCQISVADIKPTISRRKSVADLKQN